MHDDDDPEKRIAELERSQGPVQASRPIDEARPYPPAPPRQGWHQLSNPYAEPTQPHWQQTPGRPLRPQPTYNADGPGAPQRPERKGLRARFGAAGIVLTALAVLLLGGDAVYALYAYTVGAPTTATVSSCSGGGKTTRKCFGSWNYEGKLQSGQIRGGETPGSTVDAHTYNGVAYTRESVTSGLIVAPIVVIGVIALAWWGFDRRRRE